jgi:ubiquinol-cytochrome c reductase cytochrome c1 subunit
MTALEYDQAMGDLVGYLQWMAEPAQNTRVRIGVWVLLFLVGFMFIAWRLNASFWKDIKLFAQIRQQALCLLSPHGVTG